LGIRLLRKYLNKKLREYAQKLENNGQDSEKESELFELNATNSSNKPFRLKNDIKFHLFISSAPCGDSRIFAINNGNDSSDDDYEKFCTRKNRGQLRCKLELGMGTLPTNSFSSIQTWDGIILGERLKIMSCSDKLCKANVIGVHGALLNHFIEPAYFDSIIIGSYYNKNHLARALYGRIIEVSLCFLKFVLVCLYNVKCFFLFLRVLMNYRTILG
jgi:double stranded RNA-specific editase B